MVRTGCFLAFDTSDPGRVTSCSIMYIVRRPLTPLSQEDPVAVGETLRRLIEKVAMSLHETKEIGISSQAGLAGESACELIGLSVKAVLASKLYQLTSRTPTILSSVKP